MKNDGIIIEFESARKACKAHHEGLKPTIESCEEFVKQHYKDYSPGQVKAVAKAHLTTLMSELTEDLQTPEASE